MNKKYIYVISIMTLLSIILSGCGKKPAVGTKGANDASPAKATASGPLTPEKFNGEPGQAVRFDNNRIELADNGFDDHQAKYYNVDISNGKTVYFFIIKDKNNVYRAAANACQVCADAKMGFRQEGDFMVCNTCGNKYPLEKIATEKGGCNPVPINPDPEHNNGNIIITQPDILKIAQYF